MLPHYVRQDLVAVLDDLRRSGLQFEEEWFAAQLEFRFPRIGSATADGIELELRRALEPWNVLAEQTTSGGTVRSVDSSLERIQVRVSGWTAESRYLVSCNGRHVPLQATSEPGVQIAGVRFRARRFSDTLHPTVPVHAPLVFELIDRWMARSLFRCTYLVQPPNDRHYTARPADAREAEERRRERFTSDCAVLNGARIPEDEVNPLFPGTLDLRMPAPGAGSQIESPESRS
jgi:uncharacterized protein (DUF2126 family)